MTTAHTRLMEAIVAMDSSPDYVLRLYVDVALEQNAGNLSSTARQLSMHRRTLQRILDKNTPPRRREIPTYK